MTADELELVSTQDLIDELMSRTTFQGVVVRTVQDAKSREWEGERVFRVHHNANLSTEEVGRLLEVVSRYIARIEG